MVSRRDILKLSGLLPFSVSFGQDRDTSNGGYLLNNDNWKKYIAYLKNVSNFTVQIDALLKDPKLSKKLNLAINELHFFPTPLPENLSGYNFERHQIALVRVHQALKEGKRIDTLGKHMQDYLTSFAKQFPYTNSKITKDWNEDSMSILLFDQSGAVTAMGNHPDLAPQNMKKAKDKVRLGPFEGGIIIPADYKGKPDSKKLYDVAQKQMPGVSVNKR